MPDFVQVDDNGEPFADKPPEERHRILRAALAAGILWLWDSSRRRYINVRTGRLVRQETLDRWITEIGEGARGRMLTLAERLNRKEISNAEWQIAMQAEIKQAHRAMAVLAKGGKAEMGPRDWGRVGQKIAAQNAYLLRFGAEIASGQVSEAQLPNRAQMYADAAYATYQNSVALRERSSGVRTARRVLDTGAQHCEDCPPLAALGWVPIDELVPIGATDCQVNCRCTIEYQTEAEPPGEEEQAAAAGAGAGFHVVIE
jgi:hypothetical protein